MLTVRLSEHLRFANAPILLKIGQSDDLKDWSWPVKSAIQEGAAADV